MRRFFLFVALTLFLIYFGTAIVNIGQANEPELPPNLIPIESPPEALIQEWINPAPLPVQPQGLEPPRSINDLLSVGGDSCNSAGQFILDYDGERVPIEGSETDVSGFVTESSDPVLSCNSPISNGGRGYRSAWFSVVSPADGMMTVRTVTDQDHKRNYDTVIQIYSDQTDPNDSTADVCASLIPITCNDDFYALLSSATTAVSDGATYYIQVVDRNLASSGNVILNLEIELTPEEGWVENDDGMPARLSRHTVVMDGVNAYVIAGQTTLGDSAVRTGDTWRYNTSTDTWTELAEMPAGRTVDGVGYSNTDGILLNGEIHFASGFVGVEDNYDGTHWKYNIANNSWSTVNSPLLDWTSSTAGEPVGYSQLTSYQFATQTGFYLIGGLTGKFLAADATQVNPSRILYRFTDNGSTQTWDELASMGRTRYAHTAITRGRLTCVVGGLSVENNQNVIITDGECYDRNTSTWSTPVTDLNVPRYLAGSSLGPDNKWYIYGGIDSSNNYVEEIEVYDFDTETWTVLSNNFDIDEPEMAWLRGGFVGNDLYLFGGEQSGQRPVGTVQRNTFSFPALASQTNQYILPMVSNLDGLAELTTETLPDAVPIPFNIRIHENFDAIGDVYDVYTFTLGDTRAVRIHLDVPHDSDQDLILYDGNKNVLGVSQNLGVQDEGINLTLGAGQYYVFVARVAPPPSLEPTDSNYGLLVAIE